MLQAADAGEVFEYSIKFLNGVPVAIDGDATISGFDAAVDKIVLRQKHYLLVMLKMFAINCWC